MSEENNIIKSSGNVFADLGYKLPAEALAKAKLALKICELINERHLSQAAAAKLLGVDQPKISALINGKLSGFSTDRLFRFLNALDREVEVIVRPRLKQESSWIQVVAV